MSKVIEYFKETKAELKNVIWLSKAKTFYYTVIIIVISVLVAIFLGVFDFIFLRALNKILSL